VKESSIVNDGVAPIAGERKGQCAYINFVPKALAQLSSLWDTGFMAKRNLRIVKRVRNTPVLGICESCNAQFAGDPLSGNAQSAIQKQFNAHKCEREDVTQQDADATAAAKK
jgi:hypothetical protein